MMNDNMSNLTASDANMTSAVVEVQLYAVVWSGFWTLALMILGILPSCALLVATRCKRQLQSCGSALIYNICICNIAFCLLWMPLNFGVVISAYYRSGVNSIACYAHLVLFHFCAAELAVATLLLGVQRLYGLFSRRGGRNNDVLAIAAVIFTGITGFVCTTFVSFSHSRTYSFASCVQHHGGDILPSSPIVLENNSAETMLCLIYVAASSSTSAAFFVFGLIWHQSVKAQSRVDKRRRCNYQGIPSAECGTDDDKLNISTCSQASPAKSSLRDSSDIKKSSGTLSVSKRVCLQEPKAEDIHAISNPASGGMGNSDNDDIDDEDDDDKFDLKMRMKVSKCKRSSGRRHTVANISTAEANFRGRRGSVDNQRGSGNQLNYQYIRKWSVDIVALQEQLENPKLHPLPLEELVSFRDRAPKPQRPENGGGVTGSEKKHDEFVPSRGKEAELRMIKEQLSEDGDNAAVCGSDQNRTRNDGQTQQARDRRGNNRATSASSSEAKESAVALAVNCTEEPSSSSIEVPAITIKGDRNQNDSRDDALTRTSDVADPMSNERQRGARVKEKLTYIWRTAAHILLVIASLMPLCIFLTVSDNDVGVRYVLMTVVLFQCPFQPVLIMWSDPIVQQAARRLKLKMLSLQCVCYCNIGKGKRCLGRPPEYQ